MAKNGIWSKKIREIDLFDFTSFFGLDFFKFSGPLWHIPNPKGQAKSTYDILPVTKAGILAVIINKMNCRKQLNIATWGKFLDINKTITGIAHRINMLLLMAINFSKY